MDTVKPPRIFVGAPGIRTLVVKLSDSAIDLVRRNKTRRTPATANKATAHDLRETRRHLSKT
jgi:hypothetical protein